MEEGKGSMWGGEGFWRGGDEEKEEFGGSGVGDGYFGGGEGWDLILRGSFLENFSWAGGVGGKHLVQ